MPHASTSRRSRTFAAMAAIALAALAALGATTACVSPNDPDLGAVTVDLGDSPPAAATSYTGELGTTALIQVSSDGTSWWNLGGEIQPNGGQSASIAASTGAAAPSLSVAPAFVRVELQRATGQVRINARSPLPADTYGHVRLVLSPGTYVTVDGTVGGTPYEGDTVRVVPAGRVSLIIQRALDVPLRLPRDGRVAMTWDLNSEAWITPAAMTARRVDTELVKAAATLVVH